MSIHIRLKELRLAKKLSLQDVGAAIEVSWQTVQQWENGKTAPKRKRLDDVAAFFDVTPAYLLNGVEVSQQSKDSDLSLIPMMDLKLSAGTGSIVFEIDGSRKIGFRTDYLKKRGVKPENAAGFPVEGDSMIDVGIFDGATVSLNLGVKEPRNKKYYGMWIDDRYMVKEIIKRPDGYYAISHNAAKKNQYPDRLIDSENSGIIGQVFYCGFEL